MTKLLLATDRLLQFEDIQFQYRPNFSGRKEKYNREGDRYFNIKITNPDEALELQDMGFNIKYIDPELVAHRREENGLEPLAEGILEPCWFLKIPVYAESSYSPPVVQIRDKSYVPELDEEVDPDEVSYLPLHLISEVDEMEVDNIDAVISYRQPHADGKYLRPQLKTLYIDVVQTPLERKHRIRR